MGRVTKDDLTLVEEIAQRSAVSIDNARLYEHAQRATVARDNLVAIVSHDLRNALMVVDLALATEPPLPFVEDRRRSGKQLGLIRRASVGMNRLIADLLQTASLEAGRLSVDLRPVDARPLVLEALDTLRPPAAAKSLDLKSDVADCLPSVCADSLRRDPDGVHGGVSSLLALDSTRCRMRSHESSALHQDAEGLSIYYRVSAWQGRVSPSDASEQRMPVREADL